MTSTKPLIWEIAKWIIPRSPLGQISEYCSYGKLLALNGSAKEREKVMDQAKTHSEYMDKEKAVGKGLRQRTMMVCLWGVMMGNSLLSTSQ